MSISDGTCHVGPPLKKILVDVMITPLDEFRTKCEKAKRPIIS